MKKFFCLFILFLTGCSNNILTCQKTNYPIMYEKEIIEEKFIFKKNKLINYTLSKTYYLNDYSKENYNNILEYHNLEINLLNKNIKNIKTDISNNDSYINVYATIDIKKNNLSLELLNIDKNNSLNHIKKDLTTKGYYCTIS